ncbi:site-specific DNA-methyltransferase [Lentilactobacillus hilgardii]|uniref:site-specific DNA-methyltransferase n=1 Tax=Lentilactobacillus hilgardii TaxID=1588 RepID=UPI0039E75EA3
MSEQKFNPATPNFRTEAATKIAQLFPEVVADGQIDFDALQEALSPDLELTGGEEKYEFTWRGKRDAKRIADVPARDTTLVANKDKSKNWDSTQNVYIEGDNLEVLKLLQKAYKERVKLIYLDPPYNTGKDFVYHDDFHDSYENYLEQTGQVDSEGNATTTNKETNGRFHTDWLNMMYPRLKLARDLLTEDGVIMVSIGNAESDNLSKLLNEIFGEQNKVVQFIVNSAEGGGNSGHVVNGHEFLFVYAKNMQTFDNLKRPKDIRGKIVQIEGEDYWIQEDAVRKVFGEYGNLMYEDILKYRNQDFKNKIDEGIKNKEYQLVKKSDGKHVIGKLRKVSDDYSKFNSVIKHLTAQGKRDARLDFGFDSDDKINYFDNPKPVSLMKDMILSATFGTQNDIVLDIFSGSSTTAREVINLNAEDSGNRKFIMVQLPETLDENSDAYKDGYRTIPDIAEERIRRAGDKILSEHEDLHGTLDIGFKVYELQPSTIKQWQEMPDMFEEQLALFEQNPFTESSDNQQRAQEIALKSGVALSVNPTITDDIYHFVFDMKEVFVVLGDYDGKLLKTIEAQRELPIAAVVLRELADGSEIKFNLLEMLKQDSEVNNHFNLEWL